jgi:hypothetical protein
MTNHQNERPETFNYTEFEQRYFPEMVATRNREKEKLAQEKTVDEILRQRRPLQPSSTPLVKP